MNQLKLKNAKYKINHNNIKYQKGGHEKCGIHGIGIVVVALRGATKKKNKKKYCWHTKECLST